MKLEAPEGYKFYVTHRTILLMGNEKNVAHIELWENHSADGISTRVGSTDVHMDGKDAESILSRIGIESKVLIRREEARQAAKSLIKRNFSDN